MFTVCFPHLPAYHYLYINFCTFVNIVDMKLAGIEPTLKKSRQKLRVKSTMQECFHILTKLRQSLQSRITTI